MRLVLAATLLFLTACGTQNSTAPTSLSSDLASSSTATTTASSVALAELKAPWTARFDAVAKTAGGPVCSLERVQSKGCAEYLTRIVTTTSELDGAIRKRSDATSYVGTLVETEKIFQASERYAKLRCYEGGGTAESCHAEANSIMMGHPLVITKLTLDEIKKK
jgi:hypothetical protein